MKTELLLARRYFFRGKAKHISFIGIISCLGVMLGVATVITAMSIVNGIDGGLMERIMRFREHLIVESFQPQQLNKVKEALESWEEVDVASLCLQTQVFAKFNSTIVPLAVKGVDFNNLQAREQFYQYVKKERASEGFFIGEGIKRRFFLKDKIEFYPLKKKLELQEESIRGAFSAGLYDIDNYYIVGDLEKVKELSSNYLLFLGVTLKEPFAAAQVKRKIEKSFPEEGLFASTWIENNSALFATLKLEKIAMFIILILITIIASFNIFANLTVKVVEKTKDIGILKALGLTNKSILAVFAFQGVIVGVIGTVGGVVLGLAVSYALKVYPFIRLPEEVFFTEYLPVVVNYADVAVVAGISLFISFVSSIFPAKRASKLPVCEALRYE